MRNTLRGDVQTHYRALVTNYQNIDTGAVAPLDMEERMTKTKLKIAEILLSTFENIKKTDKDWRNVNLVRVNDFGDPVDKDMFETIMTILTRVQDREEIFKDEKKNKKYWMISQLKQVEVMVKPENRVIYKKPEHFLNWSNQFTS